MPGEIQPHDLVVSSEVHKLIIPEAAVATPAMHKYESGVHSRHRSHGT